MNTDPTQSGNLLRNSIIAAGIVAGALAMEGCTSQGALSSTHSETSVSNTPATNLATGINVVPNPTTPADIYTGNVIEIVAKPVVSGHIGEEKDAAGLVANEITDSTVYGDDVAGDMRKARAEAAKLPDQLIAGYTNATIDANLGHAIVSKATYNTTSNDASTLAANNAAASKDEATVELISNKPIRAATSKALDYIQANAAVEAGTNSSQPNSANATLLEKYIGDKTIKALTVKALKGNEAAQQKLKDQADIELKAVTTLQSSASDKLTDGSASQARIINEYIKDYQAGSKNAPSARTWLKDLGFIIAYSVNDLDTPALKSETTEARKRAAHIPDAFVRQATLNEIDAKIEDALQKESINDASAETLATLKRDDADLPLITDPKLRALVAKQLAYTRAKAAIDNVSDIKTAAALLGTVHDPAVKAEAQKVNGNPDLADKFSQDAQAAADATLQNNLAKFTALYYGSNGQAQAINDYFAKYNTAVGRDGR